MKIYKKKYIHKNHISGFVLSIILTSIPFILIMNHYRINKNFLTVILITCAILQIFVHFVYFLHIDFSSDKIWNTVALIFTILIIIILILGSTWIMEHLNHHTIIHDK